MPDSSHSRAAKCTGVRIGAIYRADVAGAGGKATYKAVLRGRAFCNVYVGDGLARQQVKRRFVMCARFIE